MDVYKSLEVALDELELSLTELHNSIKEIRNAIDNNGVDYSTLQTRNIALANEIIRSHGYANESDMKLYQWGIFDAQNDDEVKAIMHDIIAYRRDASLHHSEN